MSFPPHSNYKPSGLDWPHEVPGHWHLTPLKYVASLKGRLGWQGLKAEEYAEDGPYLVTSEHFTNDKIDWHRCYHVSFDRYQLAPEIQLRQHDLIVMKDGAAMGKLAYVDHLPGPACLNSHLLLFRPLEDSYLNRFLYYVLDSPSFNRHIMRQRRGTTFFGISQESIGAFPFLMPPLPEQTAIAAFLDRETGKIDALVEEQKRLIELLKEKRQAFISHAVTKGLNTDAPMKDSGVQWLGAVPEHWDVSPLKYLARLESGGTPSKARDDYWDGNIPWASAKDLKSEVLFQTGDGLTEIALKDGAATLVSQGAVIVLVRGMMLARSFPVVVAGVPMAINQDLKAITSDRLQSSFMAWMLRGLAAESLSRIDEAGHGTKALRMEAWTSMQVPIPPLHEQSAISEYLANATRQLDRLTEDATSAIALLQERRAALISAAVTGKIDVRVQAFAVQQVTDRARIRLVFGAAIIEAIASKPNSGRTKAHKLAYLAEAHGGVYELDGKYLREAAGPLDRELIEEMETQLQQASHITVEQPGGPGSQVTYRICGQRGAFRNELSAILGPREETLDKLITDLADLDTRHVEAVATLYAVWNDALIAGDTPTDAGIVSGVLNDWHPEKKEKFRADELHTRLAWMRRHGLVPSGRGPQTSTGRLFV